MCRKGIYRKTAFGAALCLSLLLCGCQSSDGTLAEPTSADAALTPTDAAPTPTEEAVQDIALKDACADYFLLGVGINGSTLDNLTTYDPEYMALVKKHFNSVTMSNLMKSCYIFAAG